MKLDDAGEWDLLRCREQGLGRWKAHFSEGRLLRAFVSRLPGSHQNLHAAPPSGRSSRLRAGGSLTNVACQTLELAVKCHLGIFIAFKNIYSRSLFYQYSDRVKDNYLRNIVKMFGERTVCLAFEISYVFTVFKDVLQLKQVLTVNLGVFYKYMVPHCILLLTL